MGHQLRRCMWVTSLSLFLFNSWNTESDFYDLVFKMNPFIALFKILWFIFFLHFLSLSLQQLLLESSVDGLFLGCVTHLRLPVMQRETHQIQTTLPS